MGRKATHACARCGASAPQKALKKEGDKLVHRADCHAGTDLDPETSETPVYACPVHLDVRSKVRGECPKCTAKAAPPAPVEAPAEKKPRVNRRGKPTVENEAARTCRVRGCGCSVGKSCDMGVGRTCCWTSADTPAEGDTCSLCAELIDAAEEAIEKAGGKVPDGLAAALYENCDAPALGDDSRVTANARLGACIEIAVARRTPSKKDRPRDTRKPAPEPPAQVTLPGSEVARTLTLPMGREPLAVVPADRGACEACGTKLTPENSSKLPGGRVVHVGCAAGAPSSDHRAPCTDCGAEQGEPCAHATLEPASYIHDARLALLPAEERQASRRRAAEDRIRIALDEHARIPGDPPVPSRDGLVRALVVPGDFDAFTLRDVLGAMIERGEVCEHASDRVVGATYLRRAEGAPPVVMGRVGVREKTAAPGEPGCVCSEIDASDRPCIVCEAKASDAPQEPPTPNGVARCDVCGDPATCRGEHDGEATAGCDEHCGHGQEDGRCELIARLTVTPPPPPPGVESCDVCDPDGGGCDHEGEPGHRAAPTVDESSDLLAEHQAAACDRERALNIAALLSERPDERLAAQLGAAASHVEDLATFVRHAAEALQALRAEARELSELRAEVESLRVEAALERSRARTAEADRTVLRAGINRAGDVLTRAALPGKIGEGLDAAGLAAELEKLAWASVEKEKAGSVKPLRQALHDIIGELGGELPEEANDDELRATALERAIAAAKAVRDLASQIDTIATERNVARSERDIAQGDTRNMAGRVMRLRAFIAPLAGLPAPHEATDHELIAAAEQHVLPLRAAVEGAIAELTGESATSAKPLAEQLHEAVRATAAKLAVRRMRVPGATPETDTQPKPRVVF